MNKFLNLQGIRTRLAAGFLAAAAGLQVLALAANARADMCLGGGSDPNAQPQSKDAGQDGALGKNGQGKRNLGMGLLAAATMSTVWLSLRRPGRGKNDDHLSS